jgi:ribosomal subunit interface protein
MKLPMQVTYRNMSPSAAMEDNVREKVEKLDQFYDQIMSCRVMIEAHHKHHHEGNLYHVRIDLKVPDEEIVVSREHDLHHSHSDVYVAIRDAFDAARRQLEDYIRRRRQHVKTHETPLHGIVSRMERALDYGIITSSDGREIYFHRNSVLDAGFDDLTTGTEVRFHEETGEQGPQASTVKRVGKHHPVG